MKIARLALTALCASACLARAGTGELVMLAPLDHTMPMAQFKDSVLVGGIMKDVGDALAAKLGRQVRYVTTPGDKVGTVLLQGGADGVCHVLPAWIDGDFNWSKPFIPGGEMVAARSDAPAITSVTALRDVPVGAVASFRYPRISQVLGSHFRREDAPSLDHIMRRVTAGKLQYLLVGQYDLLYHQRMGREPKLRGDLVFATFDAQCAFSRASLVPFGDIEVAIHALAAEGAVERILRRYR